MPDTYTPVSRRRFCIDVCQAASCTALAPLAAACSGGSSPASPGGMPSMLPVVAGQLAGSSVRVAVAGSPLAEIGGAALVESAGGVFLLSRTSAGAFTALDAICTHESCTITGADGTVFVCQCHGSRYNRSGQVLTGPATASLRQYATSFADGVVTIAI